MYQNFDRVEALTDSNMVEPAQIVKVYPSLGYLLQWDSDGKVEYLEQQWVLAKLPPRVAYGDV